MEISSQKYAVNQYLLENLLSWITSKEIAIPEIQRPFVWDSTKVRNLIDSLYKGYPIGYLIIWRSPNIKLKDGRDSEGKKILIDGQQRIIALTTSILGQEIIDKNYQKKRIKIAFNPKEEKFEVANPAIEKDKSWIADISVIIKDEISLLKFLNNYCSQNPDIDPESLEKIISKLKNIIKRQIGVIELSGELDINTVTEIFERINSEGVALSQTDFAMSRMAANEKYDGSTLRKAIDYFCHLAKEPGFFDQIGNIDKKFTQTEYFKNITWLKNENDDLYDPDYKDVIRVVFTYEFKRGKLADLVSLLSGRDFESRSFEEEIIEKTFFRFKIAFNQFVNETNFKRFLMIIRSAGFIDKDMIRSKNSINFAYALYLYLRNKKITPENIERIIRRWFVMSILTERYSGSAETKIDKDIRTIESIGVFKYLEEIEKGELSSSFWENVLPRLLESPIITVPSFNIFLAAQVKDDDKGFLSTDIKIADLIALRGDVHHIYPKNYLKKYGLNKSQYNQVANYVYMQQELNIKISDQSPKDYLSRILAQINENKTYITNFNDEKELLKNLKQNCIPEIIFEGEISNYQQFLKLRRQLMAKKIEKYYEKL
ncbi:MAG: GmrSD restriction endonuclease domain-containing protein [Microgenomates group bacterium]